jgi:hypothetical protein
MTDLATITTNGAMLNQDVRIMTTDTTAIRCRVPVFDLGVVIADMIIGATMTGHASSSIDNRNGFRPIGNRLQDWWGGMTISTGVFVDIRDNSLGSIAIVVMTDSTELTLQGNGVRDGMATMGNASIPVTIKTTNDQGVILDYGLHAGFGIQGARIRHVRAGGVMTQRTSGPMQVINARGGYPVASELCSI